LNLSDRMLSPEEKEILRTLSKEELLALARAVIIVGKITTKLGGPNTKIGEFFSVKQLEALWDRELLKGELQ
jgi:hypothetical protein